ncbi:hypothetical protein GCM10020370_41170 [Paenibacillus hodogayensis]
MHTAWYIYYVDDTARKKFPKYVDQMGLNAKTNVGWAFYPNAYLLLVRLPTSTAAFVRISAAML